MLLHTLQKKLALFNLYEKSYSFDYLFNLSSHTKWREAGKIYDIRDEEQINCVGGNTLF